MAKRTKFSKFRSLYDVIEILLDTYTHEGVVEILAESHDLELSVSTLRSYLYRYKKQSKELSVATDNASSQSEDKPDIKKQIIVDLYSNDPIQESNTDASDEPYVQPTHEELDTSMKRFEAKLKLANERNSSLVDK
ncbi:hypothetical protein [Psychrobacter sp. GP33]|uniref:hypothetical protein n=1 Tax=Psychrobacter sp. GP33 TaxID=2758709 RepID=UPI0015FD728B|nr:hypothetical protein [Psychrobacter sp. GP33]